jgi:LacI family transcriptional regulator
MADCFDPPLTTIRLDGAEVGRQTAEVVLAAIRGLPVPTRATPVPAELVVRASARRPAARRARQKVAP